MTTCEKSHVFKKVLVKYRLQPHRALSQFILPAHQFLQD